MRRHQARHASFARRWPCWTATDVGIPVCCRGEPPVAGGEEAGGAETDGNFDRFDINADGFLSQREIKAFMTEMGFHAKPDYLRDLIGNFGVEVSGFLPGRFAHCQINCG